MEHTEDNYFTRFQALKLADSPETVALLLNANERRFCPHAYDRKQPECSKPCGACIIGWLNEECEITEKRLIHQEMMEQKEDTTERENKVDFKEFKVKCPFCEGENENARIFVDQINKEIFVYCETCGIETVDTYESKKDALNAFWEGKVKKA